MKETTRMLCAAFLAAGVFLLLFLGLHWNLVVAILLGVGVYFGLFFALKSDRKSAAVTLESMPDGEQLQKLLDDAQADLTAIDGAVRRIRAPSVRENARGLSRTGMRILLYLRKNPEKIRLARRFFTYYLDATAKILQRYVEFQDTDLHTPQIEEILRKTADALPVLNRAFERQFTHLMQGELLDVEADIEVLTSTLKMEGGR